MAASDDNEFRMYTNPSRTIDDEEGGKLPRQSFHKTIPANICTSIDPGPIQAMHEVANVPKTVHLPQSSVAASSSSNAAANEALAANAVKLRGPINEPRSCEADTEPLWLPSSRAIERMAESLPAGESFLPLCLISDGSRTTAQVANPIESLASSQEVVLQRRLRTLEVAERDIEIRSETGHKERELGHELDLVWEMRRMAMDLYRESGESNGENPKDKYKLTGDK